MRNLKGNTLTWVLVIVGVVLVVLVGWYVVRSRSQTEGYRTSTKQGGSAQSATFAPLSKDNSVTTIDSELSGTPDDNLDSELNSVSSDLSAI